LAVIGDFGGAGTPAYDVSELVKSWDPDFVVTLGDNNYPAGEASTIDESIGQYYSEFIFPYVGKYGPGAGENRFFPILGNHDWETDNASPYLNYFTLPGNERYYDFVIGPIHFFALDSDPREPDGVDVNSTQAQWLEKALRESISRWKVILIHHPPFSSSMHGSQSAVQWPYRTWGADIVLSGHEHVYERLEVDGFPYIVNGLGGRSLYSFRTPVDGSKIRYSADYGGLRIDGTTDLLRFQFVARTGEVVDDFNLIHE
jgi:tartrate-resistant acid phosphatase type 5